MYPILTLVRAARFESIREMKRTPDYVLISPLNKFSLREYFSGKDLDNDELKLFGMKIIWTNAVEYDKPVCVYDAFRPSPAKPTQTANKCQLL